MSSEKKKNQNLFINYLDVHLKYQRAEQPGRAAFSLIWLTSRLHRTDKKLLDIW